MDPKDVAAQQDKLAQHRAQQNHTKSDHPQTSAAKSIDPEGQIPQPRAVKRDFERSHDHAPPEMTPKQPGPEMTNQEAPAPRPKPPGSVGPEVDRQAHTDRIDRLKAGDQAHKAGQEAADHGNMKDGKDHD